MEFLRQITGIKKATKEQKMNNLTLSYSLTLSQSIYPNLNYLIKIKLPAIANIEEEKVLAIDLSPSEKRLLAVSVVEKQRHSRPAFFKAIFTSLLSEKPLTQLVVYSSLIESYAIKLKKLTKWIDLHDYEYR